MLRMSKKKPAPERAQAVFRLEADEEVAFARYTKTERFPLTLADLSHRLLREFLVDSGYLLESSETADE
jgi:hypothetical protein